MVKEIIRSEESSQLQNAALTPMMQQYMNVKEQHKDCLLFYRMGDFYELFFDDAVQAARILDIALTKRGKHDSQDIPMCGVPFHSSDNYLYKLIRNGFKVAICEQLETPEEAKKRGYKEVVKREVVRIITPGTLTEEALLPAKEPNYLAALVKKDKTVAIAWLDLSTCEFYVTTAKIDTLSSELAKINPKELLISEKILEDNEIYNSLQEWKSILTPHVANFFDAKRAERNIKAFYEVETLSGIANFDLNEISVCGALIEYINITQKGSIPRLEFPHKLENTCFMVIDNATRRNLELFCTLSGERKGSLLSTIDLTLTNAGGRLFYQYLSAPLVDVTAIKNRQDIVEFFSSNQNLREQIRETLKKIPDIERALSRLSLNRGGPRDLLVIKTGLTQALRVAELIEYSGIENVPEQLRQHLTDIGGYEQLLNELQAALKSEVPMLARDGGFVNPGYHSKLDELNNLQENSKELILNLREKYRSSTGITTLKIDRNNILGYFVDVTPQAASKLAIETFIHRQTLASSVRYTTIELRELETEIISSSETIQRFEIEIFNELLALANKYSDHIIKTAHAIAKIDVASSLGELAVQKNYCRPVIDNSREFKIENGRHPVVEAITSNSFIPNNCNLNPNQRLWLITGPNMAGKSTFLRQNALIAMLAQIGSFVPASYAHIGVVDRLFSRVGAADDLAKGLSTFMIEMIETATILNQSTEKSLIILDEIGRGTATYDGLSIAWSCLEYIHDKLACRTLFATHYHELTELKDKMHALRCYSMRVKEWQGKIIFLHEIAEGSANRSYGIYVAKLAGLPKTVIKRAESILSTLESNKNYDKLGSEYLPLLSFANDKESKDNSQIEQLLLETNIDDLKPREAIELLYKMKELVQS
jgi:DNA mismatch repair protein MutS